jgi:FKBP-type peptidyl-prolyl cis-trans isomerase SlyD
MTAAIGKHSVVEIHYTLKNAEGEVLDTSADGEPLMYLHGTHGLIQGLENELLGKKVGDSFKAVIPPELAYGEVDPDLIHSIDKSMFRGVDHIEPGMVFTAQGEHGHQHITVKAVDGDKVTIDGNHEMAGQTLYFDVEVVSIRDATEEEIDHGHVHAHGDHHHH